MGKINIVKAAELPKKSRDQNHQQNYFTEIEKQH